MKVCLFENTWSFSTRIEIISYNHRENQPIRHHFPSSTSRTKELDASNSTVRIESSPFWMLWYRTWTTRQPRVASASYGSICTRGFSDLRLRRVRRRFQHLRVQEFIPSEVAPTGRLQILKIVLRLTHQSLKQWKNVMAPDFPTKPTRDMVARSSSQSDRNSVSTPPRSFTCELEGSSEDLFANHEILNFWRYWKCLTSMLHSVNTLVGDSGRGGPLHSKNWQHGVEHRI
jgi:hypothetical protein